MNTNKQDRKVRKALKKYGKGLEASRKGDEKRADRMQSKGAKKARKAGMAIPRLEEFEKRGYNMHPKSGRVYGGGGKMTYGKGGKMCSCGKMAAGKCNCGKDKSYGMGGKVQYKKGGKFPDLNKDGKITKADILMGRGVGMKKKKK